MRHQPFENWIIEETGLSLEQRASLQAHLASCEDCRKLQTNWAAARSNLRTAPIEAPAPGFTLRWKASLPERRRQQQKLQERRLLLFLVAGAVTSLLALAAYLFATTSPAGLLVDAFGTVTRLLAGWNHTERAILPFLQSLPLVIPVAFWILLTTGVALLSVVWVVAVWRISPQGVTSK